jgi:ferredoxin
MPMVVFHKGGQTFRGEVSANSNLVVKAATKLFPYPNLRFGCGMGKCAKCACRIIRGGEFLPPPNWKEKERLGARIEQGYRLVCQLWIDHDIELSQDSNPIT